MPFAGYINISTTFTSERWMVGVLMQFLSSYSLCFCYVLLYRDFCLPSILLRIQSVFLIPVTRWQCVSSEILCHALRSNLNKLFRQDMPFRCIAIVSSFLIEKDMPCVLYESYKDFQVILIY